MERPDFFQLKNGEKVKLPFSNQEYNNRVSKLRKIMSDNKINMILFSAFGSCLLAPVFFKGYGDRFTFINRTIYI